MSRARLQRRQSAGRGSSARANLPKGRAALRDRLETRRSEIEQAFLTRIYAISDPGEVADPLYAEGLRSAVSAALDFALSRIEVGEDGTPPPVTLLAQARLAARSGISLDTVLRRYFAGFALFTDFVIDEADRDGLLSGDALKSQLRTGAAAFDALISTVTQEYVRERSRHLTPEQHRTELIDRLLGGELIDTSSLLYDFDGYHLALIASGEGCTEIIRDLVSTFDCRLLTVGRPEGTIWAWLGRRTPLDPAHFKAAIARRCPRGVVASFGEPAEQLPGWRLSHRQAKAAFSVSARLGGHVVRYAEALLPIAALQDDLLYASLHQLYFGPLEGMRDGGKTGCETLRAYFAAGRNVSATAAALRISRQAVTSRLRSIEQHIAQPIDDCVGELETIVRIAEAGPPPKATGELDSCKDHVLSGLQIAEARRWSE